MIKLRGYVQGHRTLKVRSVRFQRLHKKPFLLFSSLIGGKKGELKKKIQREKQISINIYPISWKEAFFTLLGIKELVGRLYLPWYSF